MDTDTTTETEVTSGTGDGEGSVEAEILSVPKQEYDKLNQTLGALKRELKDLKKPKEAPVETPQTKPEDNSLVQKSYLRAAGVTHPEDVELALSTAKKWGMEVDALVDDEDFKIRLERQQTARANELATKDVRSGQGSQEAKTKPEFWMAKGTPPTAADVPNRKDRAAIARAMLADAKTGKKFYND